MILSDHWVWRSWHSSKSTLSETASVRERRKRSLLNGTIFDDLEWPLTTVEKVTTGSSAKLHCKRCNAIRLTRRVARVCQHKLSFLLDFWSPLAFLPDCCIFPNFSGFSVFRLSYFSTVPVSRFCVLRSASQYVGHSWTPNFRSIVRPTERCGPNVQRCNAYIRHSLNKSRQNKESRFRSDVISFQLTAWIQVKCLRSKAPYVKCPLRFGQTPSTRYW